MWKEYKIHGVHYRVFVDDRCCKCCGRWRFGKRFVFFYML